MATNVSLPPEIIEEILQRLPAKALGRFKCLSRQLKTLISSVRFMNSHIDFSSRLSREKLILLSYDLFLYTVDLVDLKNDKNVSELMATEVRFVPRFSDLDGSCNGLIATSFPDASVTSFLVNPTTGEFTEVFNRYELLPKGYSLRGVEVLGFGYDSLTDDYKFVSIIRCSVENVGGKLVRLVVVRSLKSNRLRMDIKPPDYYKICGGKKLVYLNECIHWLCRRGPLRSLFIAVFDLQQEEFKEMGVPQLENILPYNPLIVVSGCLCVFGFTSIGNESNDYGDGFSMEMWVMKEYGVSESWMKISIDRLDTTDVLPLYLLGDREVVLKIVSFKPELVEYEEDERFKPELVVYNEDERTLREVTISGVHTTIFHIEGTCVESLVSPKYRLWA